MGFGWQGAGLLRVTTAPDRPDVPGDLDLFAGGGTVRGREWLVRCWSQEKLRRALTEASPVLAQAVERIVSGRSDDVRRTRRAVLAVASYLLRWEHRATPFGLFAGVAPISAGDTARAVWPPDGLRVHTRADAGWVAEAVEGLERCPALLERLDVITADTAGVRGGRWVVPAPPGPGGEVGPVETSVRHTGPVAAALEFAARPIRYADLREELTQRYPSAGPGRVEGMLAGLVAEGVMLTGLRAPMDHPGPLGHVCTVLEKADAEAIDGITGTVTELLTLRETLATADSFPAWLSPSVRRAVDTTVEGDVRLPMRVIQDAERAVTVLCRLSPYPFGSPAWRDYRGRFRTCYGTRTPVPVLDLVADSGLGLPVGYLGSPYTPPGRPALSDRDDLLLRLVQQAALDGTGGIVLTDELIDQLAPDSAATLVPSPTEVAFELHAAPLDGGAYLLHITQSVEFSASPWVMASGLVSRRVVYVSSSMSTLCVHFGVGVMSVGVL
ncbi:lantibiotic dehydratase family protein [Streptomyces sp. NPDC093252]|uniref:lantibiotic dehydratase family protein n=1 Tax=Streptomyces sp. NPDC093252 TaxID=3154980 RepID=UPI00341EFB5D